MEQQHASASTAFQVYVPKAAPRLFRRLGPGLDLRDEVQLESLMATADGLIDRVGCMEQLVELDDMLAGAPAEWPLAARIAARLARSKALLMRRRGPLHLSVVMPVFGEHQRILRPEQHALGEGFLDRKLRQLGWLLGARSDQSFDLLVVDDGCPHASGHIAQQILRQRHPRSPARVSFLADAIEAELPVVAPMRSVDDSRKGGSIHYGMWQSTRLRQPGHVVLYTDADLSTHLGQSGLLIDALDRPGVTAAAGSRRAKGSIVVKGSTRSARGRLFIYLWKKLLPEIAYLNDTQCGFKAFRAADVRRLVDRPRERGFAFDLEVLLRSELSQRRSVASVPVAWIDSEAASTLAAGPEPYLPMLRSIVGLYRHHFETRPGAEPFARAIETLDDAGWQWAIDTLGPQLECIDPSLDAEHASVPASALLAAAA